MTLVPWPGREGGTSNRPRCACRGGGLVHLQAVAVELDLEEPAFALGETVAEGRIAGWDERGTQYGSL